MVVIVLVVVVVLFVLFFYSQGYQLKGPHAKQRAVIRTVIY